MDYQHSNNLYAHDITNRVKHISEVPSPNRLWKVIVVLPMGINDVSRVSNNTRVIAVNTPNDNAVSSDWGGYRTSVDAIEQATGLDILSAVPINVQARLEAQVDSGPTQ